MTPSFSLTTSCRNSSGVRRSVLATRFTDTIDLFGASERREVVVACKRFLQLRRSDAASSHPVRPEPDPHGECPVAENVGALYAADRAQPRLNNAHQIVGDLVLVEFGRGKLR